MNYFVIRKIYLATALIWLGAGDLFGQYAITIHQLMGTLLHCPSTGPILIINEIKAKIFPSHLLLLLGKIRVNLTAVYTPMEREWERPCASYK